MAKILVIEDDQELAEVITGWLKQEHYQLEQTGDGSEGWLKLHDSEYDLVILDWGLPGMTGLEICQQLRNEGNRIPIIMLTAKGLVSEKETGLDAGADDYLTKPFNMKELSARIRAMLRRASGSASNVLKARDIELDPQKFLVYRNGVEVRLLPKEFSLLEFLMRHPNEPFSSDALLARVWSSGSEAGGDAIRSCLKRLRKKLADEDDSNPLIETVHGIGYRLRI